MANIEDRVKEIIVEQLGVSEDAVKPEAKLVEDLGADSLDVVELVMALEENFDVTVDEDEQDKLETVGQIIDYVKGKADE
jgi:acyl carrier protein